MGFLWDDKTASGRMPLMGQRQPMSQVAGRAPARPMPGPGMPQQPGGRGPAQGAQPPMDPMQARRMVQVRKMMLQSELLKVRAIEAMMGGGGGAKGKKPSGG